VWGQARRKGKQLRRCGGLGLPGDNIAGDIRVGPPRFENLVDSHGTPILAQVFGESGLFDQA
jgi:hypothetical protein